MVGVRMYGADRGWAMGSGRTGGRRAGRIRLALVALVAAGVAVACGPAEGGGGPAVPPPSSAAPTTASPSPTPSLTATPAPATPSTGSPSPSASAAAPDAKAPSQAPAPTRSASRPAAQPTTRAAEEPAQASCEIVSNAGNCYSAGQYCRKADVGRITHAANGRMISCRQDGGQPRWGY
ncbi:hypothetical protein [Streptomyces sp. NPDC001594]|uniref:hypothetical protein n=1 Tax=Streptomyces sp. NPDC001594 TaxID=3364590 RepID=UPI00367D2208